MIGRRAWLAAVAGPPPMRLREGDLDDPPPDVGLWRLTVAVAGWLEAQPSHAPPAVALAALHLSTVCQGFAQAVAIHLNARGGDAGGVARGLDGLVVAVRRVITLAERHSPAWAARLDTSPLGRPDPAEWLGSDKAMGGTFDGFWQVAERLEWVARRMAAVG